MKNQMSQQKTHRTSVTLCLSAMALALAAALGYTPAMAEGTAYRVADTQHLDGDIKWDYLTFDKDSHRLFITRGDHVDVYDIAAKKVTATIAGTDGVHGVALAPELNRGFTTNGKSGDVTVFELSTLKVLGTVPAGKKPDAIVFDTASKHVFAANGDSNSLTVIDPLNQKALGTIALEGKPEFAVVDGKGKLFVNIEDKNQLVEVDTIKMKVLHTHNMSAVCDEPAGLSINMEKHTLFAGCHNQKMAIVDGRTGKVIATPAIGKNSDATIYDATAKLAFSSNGDGTLTVIGNNAKGGYEVKQTLKTMVSARTMALDPDTHTLYLVAAEAETDPAAKPDQRPKLKPGSFTLLTVMPQ